MKFAGFCKRRNSYRTGASRTSRGPPPSGWRDGTGFAILGQTRGTIQKYADGGRKMSDAANTPTTQQIYKVAVASIVGSIIEQYDFLVTGIIAATVWGGIFFKLPGLAAVAAALGVYGLGIIIRPLGAFIF